MKEAPVNLIELLDNSAGRYPKRVALVFGARKITYANLADATRRLAAALHGLGIRKHQAVALWLSNCPEFIYSFFAVLRLGAAVVPVNTMLKREEARFIIEDAGARLLICSVDKVDDSKNILGRLQGLKHLISLPAPAGDPNVLSFHELLRQAPAAVADELGEDYQGLAEIVYTSGTTGKPKGVCLTHANLVSNVRSCARAIHLHKRDCLICVLPLFHSFASTVCMLLPLSCGARVVLMRTVRPFKRVIRALARNRVTIFVGIPSLFSILSELKLSGFQKVLNFLMNPVRLAISGAAALPASVWEKFEKKYRRPLLQGYGLTEASPVVSLNPLPGKRKPDSIGLPLEGVEVKIVNTAGQELIKDEVGEILVKGPNVMEGYFHLEAETKAAIRDGWLYTGDLGKKDQDNYIYIMGRSKEMINVRGFNVYPREIEDLLCQYPRVKEAAVVGVSHRHRGEAPVAFVVADTALTQKEILDYLRNNLASYKVPLKVFFLQTLPKNATGKILKFQLAEQVKDIFA